jgi:uncharacterized protein
MAQFFKRLNRAVKAATTSTEKHTYQITGKSIICPHCGNDRFDKKSALLNTAGLTFLNLDWANRSATVLVCKKCGYIQWFMQEPENA